MLAMVGLWAESDALLKGSLGRSPAPYYLMGDLAVNARDQGHTAEALDWSRQAWEHTEGSTWRLRWGTSYLGMLVDLAPADDQRIEAVAHQVLAEAAQQSPAFLEGNARLLQRIGTRLAKWNATAQGHHQAVLDRLAGQIAPSCARLPGDEPAHATCTDLFKTAAGAST